MAKPTPDIIFYWYPQSPHGNKINYLLALRKIPHKVVDVSWIPPRPQLQMLGIDYRRIPVLAVNETVYCDTFAIAQALEEAFPESAEHPSIFPKDSAGSRNIGAQKLVAEFWGDRPYFALGGGFLPWDKLPEVLLKDRSAFRGAPFDAARIKKMRPLVKLQIAAHLDLLEQQLAAGDGRSFFGTSTPSYVDVSAFFVLNWIERNGARKEVLNPETLPKTVEWYDHLSKYLADAVKSTPVTKITGSEAASLIRSHHSRAAAASSLPFLADQASLIGLSRGTEVVVTPDDVGKVPTSGTLVGFTTNLVTIETKRRDEGGDGVTRVAFSRLGFVVLPTGQTKL